MCASDFKCFGSVEHKRAFLDENLCAWFNEDGSTTANGGIASNV
jgi:hypothetical protein